MNNTLNELSTTLQQRADYIPIEDLLGETASEGRLFKGVVNELTNRGPRTIVGPRGCGKTHMMRYAWITCRDNKHKPFAIFSSYQRYFRLEPLLSSNAGALQLFHSWVLARILISCDENCKEWGLESNQVSSILENEGYPINTLSNLLSRLERNQVLNETLSALSDSLSIEKTKIIINQLCDLANRKFTVLLLDDAAMTLTPNYLIEFLDIVRSLKSTRIAPKVSVYPGTTEVSPRFHQGQDTAPITAWISFEDPEYESIMRDIADVRVHNLGSIPNEVQSLFMISSFGIPRAFLTMLEDYQRSRQRSIHQKANRVINDHLTSRLSEFKTLGMKIPKFEQLVLAGDKLLNSIAKELKKYNEILFLRNEKGLHYGIRRDEITPLLERTLKLLIEAGLLFYSGDVKHGTPERIYDKYTPHTALLIKIGTFNKRESGGSVREILEIINYKSTKHPLRKKLSQIVGDDFIPSLNLALPHCANCNERRMADNQRFCHSCGHQLVDASDFSRCLKTLITEVPGITDWQKLQLKENLPKLKTVGDFLAKQDPAAELLTVAGFGRRRTTRIIDILNSFVDDFLS